jgi:hypothetical protein
MLKRNYCASALQFLENMQGADCMKKKVKRTWEVTRRQPDKAVMYDITALFDGCIYSARIEGRIG